MGAFSGSRLLRLVAVVVVIFIVWQLWVRLRPGPEELVTPSGPLAPQYRPGFVPLPPAKPGAVRVEVYYEALCPDSMNFIVEQLAPAASRLSDDVMHIVYVPYGKATTQYYDKPDRRPGDPPPVSFSCQHGSEECWANKVHACGVRQATGQQQRSGFVTCLMKQLRRTRQKAEECARANGLDWKKLAVCVEDDPINFDMELYGNMTHGLKPRVSFIPTITIDGKQDHQSEMFSHFLGLVCRAHQARSGSKAEGCP